MRWRRRGRTKARYRQPRRATNLTCGLLLSSVATSSPHARLLHRTMSRSGRTTPAKCYVPLASSETPPCMVETWGSEVKMLVKADYDEFSTKAARRIAYQTFVKFIGDGLDARTISNSHSVSSMITFITLSLPSQIRMLAIVTAMKQNSHGYHETI